MRVQNAIAGVVKILSCETVHKAENQGQADLIIGRIFINKCIDEYIGDI